MGSVRRTRRRATRQRLPAASPRWKSSAPAVSSKRLPSASTRSASAGGRPFKSSASIMSIHQWGDGSAMQHVGAGGFKEACGGRLLQANVVFDLQEQRFDRNAVGGGRSEERRV